MVSEEELAEWRRRNGIEREVRVPRDAAANRPHPSRGGSTGYSLDFRQEMVAIFEDGGPVPERLRSSIYRWRQRIAPYRQTGNKAGRALNGESRFLLVLYKKIYPEAEHWETSAFIADHSTDGLVHSDSEISNALKDLDMTRKKASTTAYEAFSALSMQKYDEFWTMPHPLGVLGTPRCRLIDVDEFGLCYGDANRSFGHNLAGLCLRVRKMGNYGRGEVKVTVLLGIEAGDPSLPPHVPGSLARPRVWCRTYPGRNTTAERYRDFLRTVIIDSFRADEPQRTFIHDNLNAHKSDIVYDAVYMEGHQITCRPPYRPNIAPVEFGIEEIASEIRSRCFSIKNVGHLVLQIQILASTCIKGQDANFAKCGYQR